MRAARYCRVRLGSPGANRSLVEQEDALDAYLRSRPGWRLIATYRDCTLGAERPSLGVALADAEAGRFDVLVVHRLDRLTRSAVQFAAILDTLDGAGVGLASVCEPFDTTTAEGRMMGRLLGVFSEFQAAVLAERVSLAAEQVVREAAHVTDPGAATVPADWLDMHRAEWSGRDDDPWSDEGEG